MANYIAREIKGTGNNKFWNKVLTMNDATSCWEWHGAKAKGYGIHRHDGKQMRATHYVWRICKSVIPDGLVVLHTCDNPGCVRPSHLLLGTRADNRRDCVSKGRHTKGTACWNAKLDPAKVTVVRTLYGSGGHTQKEIAELLGVTQPCISYVCTGMSWRNVEAAS
jgi:hypothetical protein